MSKSKELSFSTYAERRLQLALHHEFPTRGELESLIMLLISEADTFNPVDFGFLYHMIENTPIYGRVDKIHLFRSLRSLDIPVQSTRESKIARRCLGNNPTDTFRGLFMPLNMPMLDILLSSGWVPEPADVVKVAGTPELRWVIERLHLKPNDKWKEKLVQSIINEVPRPKLFDLLDYLLDIEGWDFSENSSKGLQDLLIGHVDIYRKYRKNLRLFSDGTNAITYLNSASRHGSVMDVMYDALEIATPKLALLLDPVGNRAHRRNDEGWGCLCNIVECAMRSFDMGLLERTMIIRPNQFNPQAAAHWRANRYLCAIAGAASRAQRLDPWRLLFKYVPRESGIVCYGRIPRVPKFDKFAAEVAVLFREQYGADPPARRPTRVRRAGRGMPDLVDAPNQAEVMDEEPIEDE